MNPVFNKMYLSPYTPPFATHQERPPPPPPEMVDGHQEWLVNSVIDSRTQGRGVQYYVQWEGFGLEEDKWEPWSSFGNSIKKVHEFHLKNPNKPKSVHYKRWLETDGPDRD